ncbi:hypothetical protein C8R46DRAFT_1023794 [Mycena filopes]|nr:hypothetical protein C8R46DRAFT_1023794 [Mycena filopes]
MSALKGSSEKRPWLLNRHERLILSDNAQGWAPSKMSGFHGSLADNPWMMDAAGKIAIKAPPARMPRSLPVIPAAPLPVINAAPLPVVLPAPVPGLRPLQNNGRLGNGFLIGCHVIGARFHPAGSSGGASQGGDQHLPSAPHAYEADRPSEGTAPRAAGREHRAPDVGQHRSQMSIVGQKMNAYIVLR